MAGNTPRIDLQRDPGEPGKALAALYDPLYAGTGLAGPPERRDPDSRELESAAPPAPSPEPGASLDWRSPGRGSQRWPSPSWGRSGSPVLSRACSRNRPSSSSALALAGPAALTNSALCTMLGRTRTARNHQTPCGRSSRGHGGSSARPPAAGSTSCTPATPGTSWIPPRSWTGPGSANSPRPTRYSATWASSATRLGCWPASRWMVCTTGGSKLPHRNHPR